jgi:CRP/FNR family transcriptional regulator, cyclic AMP receptor protein
MDRWDQLSQAILGAMKQATLVQHLADVPLFAACSKNDLKIVARHAVEVDAPADTVLVEEGEHADTFFVLLTGEATVRRRGNGTRSRKVSTLQPGAWFGELAVLDPAPRNATVSAASPVTLAAISARSFRALLREVPALNERLLAGLARRLREQDAALATQ